MSKSTKNFENSLFDPCGCFSAWNFVDRDTGKKIKNHGEENCRVEVEE